MKWIYHISKVAPFCFLFILSFLTSTSKAQPNNTIKKANEVTTPWFVSAQLGTQMSGIKSEDFIKSNYSPLINITAGKWFTPYMGLQIGYKGLYFNYIEDDLKHHYDFFYGEALLNMHQLFNAQSRVWNLVIHAGSGYFYNHFYGRPNICANVGIQQQFKIIDNLHFTLDVSAIMGWDIYQGNKDILPGVTFGFTYSFI